MKTLVCSLFLSMVSALGFAQSEPDFEFEPYVFNASDSTFETPLPCENAYTKAKAAASMFIVGLGKVKSYFYIKGATSPLTLDNKANNIIVNTGGTSPQQCLSIIMLETLQSKRRWKSGEAGSFTGASSNEDNAVVLKYKKYGESSVIVSAAALKPGEYCLAITNMMTNSKSAKVYTFSIKDKDKKSKKE